MPTPHTRDSFEEARERRLAEQANSILRERGHSVPTSPKRSIQDYPPRRGDFTTQQKLDFLEEHSREEYLNIPF